MKYPAGVKDEVTPLRKLSEDVNAQTDKSDTPEDADAESVYLQQSANTVGTNIEAGVEDLMSTLVLAGVAGANTSSNKCFQGAGLVVCLWKAVTLPCVKHKGH